MIGIFNKILLDNEEIYLHIQNIFDTVTFGSSSTREYSSVEDAIADQINKNLDEYISPWWKQDEYVYRKCSFHLIGELLILDPDFCDDFQKIYSRSLIFTPSRIKRGSLLEKWKYKSVKAHFSGIFEVIFYFKDEEDSISERNLTYYHLHRGMEFVCNRDVLLGDKKIRKILEF